MTLCKAKPLLLNILVVRIIEVVLFLEFLVSELKPTSMKNNCQTGFDRLLSLEAFQLQKCHRSLYRENLFYQAAQFTPFTSTGWLCHKKLNFHIWQDRVAYFTQYTSMLRKKFGILRPKIGTKWQKIKIQSLFGYIWSGFKLGSVTFCGSANPSCASQTSWWNFILILPGPINFAVADAVLK